MVVKRIHVEYRLRAGTDDREVVERVHAFHKEKCPVYLSIHRAIEITTDVVMEEG